MHPQFKSFTATVRTLGIVSVVIASGCSDRHRIPTGPTSEEFAVSKVTASVDQAAYSGFCPGRFEVSAEITTSDSGTVTYCWERSDGFVSAAKILRVPSAGTHTVTTSWELDVHGAYWERMHVLAPNDIASNQAAFTNDCGPDVSASVRVSPTSYDGTCPGTFVFTGSVTANGYASVEYRWEGSDGETGPSGTLVFQSAGTRTVTLSRAMLLTGSFQERLHIFTPREFLSTPASFSNSCGGFTALATVQADPGYWDGYCPASFDFYGAITASGPGTVTYRWERSNGEVGPDEHVVFAAPGTQTVTTRWETDEQGVLWERLHILSPNDALSDPAEVNNLCCSSCEAARR